MLIVRSALDKARYFLDQAEAVECTSGISGERLSFAANLEAAIVYGRAALDHLRSELAPQYPLYRAWHDQKWIEFELNPVFRCFTQRRNFLLHREPVKTNVTVSINTEMAISVGVSFKVAVIHPDGTRETRSSEQQRSDQEHARVTTNTDRKATFYFEDPDWRAKSATAYIRQFIDICESFVTAAETMFGPPANEFQMETTEQAWPG